MSSNPHDTIGLIGLGLLGSALAERLIDANVQVVGYDIDVKRLDDFSSSRGKPASSVTDVARRCEKVLLSLPDSSVSQRVTSELTPHLAPHSMVIDTTTGDPETMEELGQALGSQGIRYVDATVAASSAQVRTGYGLVMMGGESEDVAAARSLFETIGLNAKHVGPTGSGARMKLVVNLVLGLNRAVLGEGLMFGKSLGFDLNTVLEVIGESPATSAVILTKGQKMVTGDFTPQARLRQHLKDVRLILAAAEQHHAKTPLSQWHADALQSLVDQGFGDEDNSCVIRAFE